jgi:hypothetical protein
MKNFTRLLILSLMVFAPGCAMAGGSPVSGFLIGNVSVAGGGFEVADHIKTDLGLLLRGEADVWSFLGIVSGGDSSIMAAAAAGGINKIHHVDYEVFNFLGIVASHTTVVYGEK